MTEQEALDAFFDEWHKQANEAGESLTQPQRDCAEEAWYSGIAWLRSQGEPVAYHFKDGPCVGVSFDRYGDHRWEPLYAAPQPAIPDGWREAIESISEFGDDTLCDEALMAIHASRENTEEALRIAVRLTKQEAIEKLEKLAAAPEPK